MSRLSCVHFFSRPCNFERTTPPCAFISVWTYRLSVWHLNPWVVSLIYFAMALNVVRAESSLSYLYHFWQIPLWTLSLVLNLFAVVSIALVSELRTLQFYLVNFQCTIEAIGSLSWIIKLLNDIVVNFYKFTCDYDASINDDSTTYHHYDYGDLVFVK